MGRRQPRHMLHTLAAHWLLRCSTTARFTSRCLLPVLPQGRAMLFTIPAAIQLMWHVQDVEAAVAAALWVPYTTSQPAEAVGATTATGSDGSTPKDTATVDVECGKQDLEAATGGPAGGAAAGGAAAAVPAGLLAAVAHHSPAAQLKRSRLGPYVKNAVTLLALGSSLAAWATYAKGVMEALSGLPAALSSRAGFKQGAQGHCALIRCREGVSSCVRTWAHSRTAQPQQLPFLLTRQLTAPCHKRPCPRCNAALRRPKNQFAFKLWLGLSLAMMAMMIFSWKVGPPWF